MTPAGNIHDLIHRIGAILAFTEEMALVQSEKGRMDHTLSAEGWEGFYFIIEDLREQVHVLKATAERMS